MRIPFLKTSPGWLLASALAFSITTGAAAAETGQRFPMSAGYSDGADLEVEREIAPGVVHEFVSRSELPLTINTVTIDTSRPDLRIETEAGEDQLFVRETMLSMVERNQDPDSRPIVAVNGGFWGSGNVPVNMFVDEGMIWKGPRVGVGARQGQWNAIYAFDNQGNHWIGQPDQFTMTLRGDNEEYLLLDKVNFHEDSSYAVVYTWPLGEETAPIRERQKQIILDLPSGQWLPNEPATVTVREINDGPTAPLDRNSVVIHADTPIPQWIAPGAELSLDARLPALPGKVVGIVGGIPRLVVDGVADPLTFAEREGQRPSFVTDRHPRTAVGIKEDGKTVVFVAVDGRQSRRSIGIDLIDLAEYMKSIGCVQAMNLDGGGSTTMVVRQELVNFPSDPGGPRSVGNGLMIRRNAPVGKPDHLVVEPKNVRIPTGSFLALKASAFDGAGEPIELGDAEIEWTVEPESEGQGAVELLDGDRVRALSSGVMIIRATATLDSETITGETGLTVDNPAALEFTPSAILLDPGETIPILLKPKTADGEPFFSHITLPDLSIPDCIVVDPATWEVTAQSIGTGHLTATLGDVTGSVPVSVGLFDTTTAYSFDEVPEGGFESLLDLIQANAEGTALVADADIKQEGDASWKLTYAMAGGGITRIAVDVNVELPGKPLEVGLWVYGDGQGQWLRGDMVDAKGDVYKLDFTNAQQGIDWKDEWRFLRASLGNPQSLRGGSPPPEPPFTVESIYVVQPEEARKKDGVIRLDGLSAVDLPKDL